jgi:hypothetical protein
MSDSTGPVGAAGFAGSSADASPHAAKLNNNAETIN